MLLKSRVQVRTFADWREALPGEMEIDLVAHCGSTTAGSYVSSLVLTDVVSGWTECAPLIIRESTLVVESIERVRAELPFPLRSLDTDNGGEFVNERLVQYCANNGIELTRSRPYLKNDQAWIEQKNGAVVRRMTGYARLEGLAAAEALGRLYTVTRLFVNFFQPSFKLVEKTREGARIIKRYSAPQTPAARLLAAEQIAPAVKARLREIAEKLDPLRLLDEIRAMQHHLAALASGEHPHDPPKRDGDLTAFLASLALAWRAGEVRPTHTAKPQPAHYWRTREDPFKDVWPVVSVWLDEKPDQTGVELLRRLEELHPGRFPEGQLRTLQRRLADWRMQAARRLVFRDVDETAPKEKTESF
jgi:hypothetical protein